AVEGDFAGGQTALAGLADRLASEGEATLYAVDANGEAVAITLRSVDRQLGTIEVLGGGALLQSGAALFDFGAAATSSNFTPDLRETDRPVLRIEREVAANTTESGIRRFEVAETGALGRTATDRVFDALKSGEGVLRLYTARGDAVRILAANNADGTIRFTFDSAAPDTTGAARARVAFEDMALYESPNAVSIQDRVVLRLTTMVESAPQAMRLTAARVVDQGDDAKTATISGLRQNLVEGQNLIVLDGSVNGVLTRVTDQSLDTTELHISISDTGAASQTVLNLANGSTLAAIPARSLVANLDIAVVRTPPGFDGAFIKDEDVFRVALDGTEEKVGTVEVYKEGAGELHIRLDAGKVIGYGDRLYSEYVALGGKAHTGDVSAETLDDIKRSNKQVVWQKVDPAYANHTGFVTGDSLVSTNGRALFEIGYIGQARDEFGTLISGGNIDLTFNQLRVPFQPFQPGQNMTLVARDGTDIGDRIGTFDEKLSVDEQNIFTIGTGSLDVAFGPDGWQVKLSSDAADIFDAKLIAHLTDNYSGRSDIGIDAEAFAHMVADVRDGLYLSSPLPDGATRGLDIGKVVAYDSDQRLVTLEVLTSD
ncbi:MAG: hypothetical protein P8Q89_05975, partial [Alphaproteobacteria bacterium]|nr:hypothetical protein [Alphaproteobacteria bacterium]